MTVVSAVVDGAVASQHSAGVIVTAGGGPGSFRITLDIGSLGGAAARLYFRLIAGSDYSQLDGSVAISDVVISAIPGVPPIVNAGPDQTVKEGDLVSLIGSFTDPDFGDTHTFQWHVTSSNRQVIPDGFEQAFHFTPNDNGSYTVSFIVTDSFGNIGSDTSCSLV